FVRVTVNEKENRYETSLYAVATSGAEQPRPSTDSGRPEALEGRRLTAGIRDTGPRWSPDSKRIAFVRAIEKDGKPQPAQIYVLNMEGGEARALTSGASGASSPTWSSDGRTIAFTSDTSGDEVKKSDDPKPAAEHKSDVQVMT